MLRKRLLHFAIAACTVAAAITVPATASFAATITPIQQSQMLGAGSGRCMDDPNNQTANSVWMDIYTCLATPNEQWTFTQVGTNKYRISNDSSEQCLNVSGGSHANNARIIQYSCSGAVNEVFSFRDEGDFWWELYSADSGLCITVQNAGTANNSKLIQYACTNTDNQRWHFN